MKTKRQCQWYKWYIYKIVMIIKSTAHNLEIVWNHLKSDDVLFSCHTLNLIFSFLYFLFCKCSRSHNKHVIFFCQPTYNLVEPAWLWESWGTKKKRVASSDSPQKLLRWLIPRSSLAKVGFCFSWLVAICLSLLSGYRYVGDDLVDQLTTFWHS